MPLQDEKHFDTDADFSQPHIFLDLYAARIADDLVTSTDLFWHRKLTLKKSSDLTA